MTAMQARRSYEKADEVNVFATLANYETSQVDCEVQLSVDGNVRSVRPLRIPGCQLGPAGEVTKPGRTSVSFQLSHGGSGVVEVRHLRPDALAADDAAWAVLEPPRKLSVLLVTRNNPVMIAALKACPLARLDVKTPAEFDAMDHSAMSIQQPYDVIVLDDHAPAKLPRGSFVVFGRPPEGIGVSVAGLVKNQGIVDWRARHPVLQYLNLTNLFAAQCHKLVLPRDALVLGEFNESPAMALLSRQGGVFLLVGFDVLESNWPFEPSFAMFCYNATKYLGMEMGQGRQTCLKVGQAIEVAGEPSAPPAEVKDPDGKVTQVRWDSSGTLRYPGTYRVGTYTVSARNRPAEKFAVSLLDEDESNIEPRGELVLSGVKLKAQAGPVRRTNQELWPLLAAVALALVCLEWFVYNSKVRL
ncbi:MAG: hypothetical protein AMJ81_10880 [Phycisphaerae bacterium SM23_33]|nr:MAG: hypothetical protein AMJ81_10880 [Phycisphaerae bacterium SM23_33]